MKKSARHRNMRDLLDDAGGADALAEAAHPLSRRIRRHAGPQEAHPKFRCRCGREVDTDVMLDLLPEHVPPAKRLTEEERTHCGFGADRFRCDGCWSLAVLRGVISPARLREATGQPAHKEGKRW